MKTVTSRTVALVLVCGALLFLGCPLPEQNDLIAKEKAAALAPGSPQNCAEEGGAPLALRQRAGYVEIPVTVTDASGGLVHGLTKGDFWLDADDQPVDIEFFSNASIATSVGILADTSGSMLPDIEELRGCLRQFIGNLDKRDDVLLIAFSDEPFVLQPFTTDHADVVKRLDLFHAFGRTALYDTAAAGLRLMKGACYRRKALLVISDGLDNASRTSFSTMDDEIGKRGVLLYTLRIEDKSALHSSMPGIQLVPLSVGEGKAFDTLADQTGGRAFVVRRENDEKLALACESISSELRAQYTLGFTVEGAGPHRLRVDLPARPNLHARFSKRIDSAVVRDVTAGR